MAETAEDESQEVSFKEELKAMEVMAEALQPLNAESRRRVLHWAAGRFAVVGQIESRRMATNTKIFDSANDILLNKNEMAQSQCEFSDIASLFDAASPKTNNHKTLVGGYWAQECQSAPDFTAQQINTDLKNLGHGVTNITDAFNALIAQKLVMQIRKSGTTRQARKKYRLTREGIKIVQQMLNSANS